MPWHALMALAAVETTGLATVETESGPVPDLDDDATRAEVLRRLIARIGDPGIGDAGLTLRRLDASSWVVETVAAVSAEDVAAGRYDADQFGRPYASWGLAGADRNEAIAAKMARVGPFGPVGPV